VDSNVDWLERNPMLERKRVERKGVCGVEKSVCMAKGERLRIIITKRVYAVTFLS